MPRVATAQGGNNPTEYKCGNCGEFGHNRRTCMNHKSIPVRGAKKCSVCSKAGHNKRTCPTIQRRRDFLAEAEKAEQPMLCLICDEEPLPEDLPLTPTPRTPIPEDVDIATEGYTQEPRDICGLDHDVMLMVGQQVGKIRAKINQDWWEQRIHPRFGRANRSEGWIDILSNKRAICWEISQVSRVVGGSSYGWYPYTGDNSGRTSLMECEKPVHLGMCMKPRYTKWKKVRKHTWSWKKTNTASLCPSKYYSWYHTLAERRAILQAHEDYYSVPR